MDPSTLHAALLESAWWTARIAAGLALALAAAAYLRVHLRHAGARTSHRAPGGWTRALVMVAAAAAGAAAAWWTRGEAGRWLPALAQAGVAAAAALLALASGMLAAWASATLGRNLAVAAVVREGGGLVTSGPFALVRHPLYLALGGLGAACALALGSLTGTAAFTILYSAAAAWRARLEERVLAGAWPGQWPGYAARTPRFWPRI